MLRSTLIALSLFASTVLSVVAIGEEPPAPKYPQVDTAEVLRRGNSVVVAGEGPRGAEEDAMIQATAPPPDDSYKWFIVVIKQPGCEPCARLLSDFQRAPELLAFVSAAEPYKPWAHFVVYDQTDATQQFRLKDYRIAGYPTLVVQPPLNGTWGPPGTVVWQTTGYDGNPKKLAQSITKYVRLYAAAMGAKGYPRPPQTFFRSGPVTEAENVAKTTPSRFRIPSVEGGSRQSTVEAGRPIGVDPPFPSPPKVDPFNPTPLGPSPSPLTPTPNWQPPEPAPSQTPTTPPDLPAWAAAIQAIVTMVQLLISGSGTTNLLLLVTTGFLVLERVAPLTKRVKLDDEIVALLKPLLDPSGGPAPTVPSPNPQGPPASQ